jgi:adenylate kinase
MNLVFLGPPGAGKGTVAKKIADEYGIPHISSGDLFRGEIKAQTALGKKVESILKSGELVPDDVTIDLVKSRLSQPDAENGFILDGFPRTTAQADKLLEITTLDSVLNFLILDEAVIARLSGRRTCRNCGNMHHIEFMPPKQEGVCDVCGGELFIRDDDQPESITHRLKVYKEQTQPLIEYFSKKQLLQEIDAGPAPEEVLKSSRNLLESL